MGRCTFMTVLGKENKRTTTIRMYHPGDTNINENGKFTIIEQQWLIMQRKEGKNILTKPQ